MSEINRYHSIKEQIIKGVVNDIHLSEPEIYVDNKARKRSGHMSHAMLEVGGRLMVFNSNCSNIRCYGHSAFGFIEYRFSDDKGKNFGDVNILPYSMETLMGGKNTISVEKAVACDDGTIVVFCLRNTTINEVCCDPLDEPTAVRSFDGGKTWTQAAQVSSYKGRIYDAIYKDGSIYVLQFCNDGTVDFCGNRPTHLYRLFKSDDNGASFYEQSVVKFPSTFGLGYGNMIFTKEGNLIVYAYDVNDEVNMAYAISRDDGKTWYETGKSYVAKKIRNPQIGILDDQYILHGRSGVKKFVLYTSADGLHWDEGHFLNEYDPESDYACYYSNNIVLDNPDKPGKKRMLIQFSELYGDNACVDVMHMWIETV